MTINYIATGGTGLVMGLGVASVGVKARATLAGAADVCVSATGTILALFNARGNVYFRELTPGGALLNERAIATGILCDSVSIVRSRTISYAAPLEFIIITAGVFRHKVELGALTVFTMVGATLLIPPYCYKYESAGQYLVSSPSEGVAAIGNISAGAALAIFTARYFVVQTSGGFTRHIVTKTPVLNVNVIEAVGIVGHNAFTAVFTAAPVWQSPAGVTAVAATNNCTYGGVEGFATVAGVIRGISAPDYNVPALTGFYNDRVAGATDLIHYSGQLANNFGACVFPGVSLRLNVVNGVPSFISAVQQYADERGVAITPFGEFDDSFTPSIYGVNAEEEKVIVYKYNEAFYVVQIGLQTKGNSVGKIERDIYRINTISVHNVLDVEGAALIPGVDDYHGQMSYINGAPGAQALHAMRYDGQFSSSIDPGERALSAAATVAPVNCRVVPAASSGVKTWAVQHYVAGVYSRSWLSAGVAMTGESFVDNRYKDTVYVGSATVPILAGVTYYDRGAAGGDRTYVRERGKDEYKIGNKLPVAYSLFDLYGNAYAYREGTIFLMSIASSGYLSGLEPVAVGQSLQLIAVAPTQAYFLSAWDNSMYSFDGARTLAKGARLTALPAVIKGAWSVTENSLILDTASSFIFVRDGVVSSVAKNADQSAGVALWVADDGVHIVGTAARYKYNYNPVGTVQPLAWRSAFYGLDATKQAYLSQAVFTVYSPTKAALVLKLVAEAFDMDGYYYQDEEITVNPGDYSSSGYFRARIQPGAMRGLGCAVGLECSSKIVLLDVAVDIIEAQPGTVAAKGSV